MIIDIDLSIMLDPPEFIDNNLVYKSNYIRCGTCIIFNDERIKCGNYGKTCNEVYSNFKDGRYLKYLGYRLILFNASLYEVRYIKHVKFHDNI